MQDAPRYRVYRPQAMYDTLRRLHGQDLENKGLNNLTEAFQNFMTRARCFALGNLRRTWSHGAVEFMKYRRLLPMLVADEHDMGSAFDDFDAFNVGSTSKLKDEHKIIVSNVPSRATISQLSSFFSKFGIVKSCDLFDDERRHTVYATICRQSKRPFSAVITFGQSISACRAQSAPSEELKLYGWTMIVSSYAKTREAKINFGSDQTIMIASTAAEDTLSRSSSACSSGTLNSQYFRFDELPSKALECIFCQLSPIDRIRLERTSKSFLEASAKSWNHLNELDFQSDELVSFFNRVNPLKNRHLYSILSKCSLNLKKLTLPSKCDLVGDKIIRDIGQLCPRLEELDISGIAASTEALQALSEALSSVKKISYRGMPAANEAMFWALFKCTGRILRAVDLRGCSQLTGHCFKLFGVAMEQVLLDGCHNLSDECIEELVGRCKHLKVLHISGCYNLSDQALSLISRHFVGLQTLALAGEEFKNFSSSIMPALANITSLVNLDVSFNPLVDSQLINSIATRLQNVHSLSLAYCGTDLSIDSESLLSIGQIAFLNELDVSGLAAVNSTVVENISRDCTHLRLLILHCCIYLGDDGVRSMKCAPALQLVDLSGCILVTHESIQFLINNVNSIDRNAITLRVGGTLCEQYSIQNRNSCISLDFADYSSIGLHPERKFLSSKKFRGVVSGSFVAEALGEMELAVDDDNWAAKEAAQLGLI